MSLIYLNGKLVPKEQAVVSVFDHGFLYGDGIFETMRVYNGKIFQIVAHLERLFASAQAISLKLPYSKAQLIEAMYLTLKKNQLTDASLRLTISRGPGPTGLNPNNCPHPTVAIMADQAHCYDDMRKEGVNAIIAQIRRIPANALNPEIKSANFLNNILAKIESINSNAFEAVMLNHDGYLCEGTVSNIFFVQDGILKTPHKEVGLLAGITRRIVLELAQENNIPCEEGFYHKEDLFNAKEAFLTNSGIEILPLVQINGQSIANNKPGKITTTLYNLFRAYVLEN